MRRSLSFIGLIGFIAVSLAACEKDEENEYTDVGFACLQGEPDMAYEVSVDFEQCLSSSCDDLVDASCTASLDGTILRIEAAATIRTKGSGPCTADCGAAVASCETPPLPAGTYTVEYAGQSVELTVPNEQAQVCTKEPGI